MKCMALLMLIQYVDDMTYGSVLIYHSGKKNVPVNSETSYLVLGLIDNISVDFLFPVHKGT